MKKEKLDITLKDIFKGTIGLTKVKIAEATGYDKSDDELINKRINICLKCNYLFKQGEDIDSFRCRRCKCWITKKVKLKSEYCPLHKWPK